jgi:hypothetical protein
MYTTRKSDHIPRDDIQRFPYIGMAAPTQDEEHIADCCCQSGSHCQNLVTTRSALIREFSTYESGNSPFDDDARNQSADCVSTNGWKKMGASQ